MDGAGSLRRGRELARELVAGGGLGTAVRVAQWPGRYDCDYTRSDHRVNKGLTLERLEIILSPCFLWRFGC